MKKLTAILLSIAMMLSVSLAVSAEKSADPNLDPNDPYYASSTNTPRSVSQRTITDNGEERIVLDGFENGLVGTISDEEVSLAIDKTTAAAEIQAICDRDIANGGISEDDYAKLEQLLAEFYPDASIEDFVSSSLTRANPGDKETKNLSLPGKVQETNYYCGPASAYAVLSGRGIPTSQNELAGIMGTDTDGTLLGNEVAGLNYYRGVGGNNFRYALYAGPQLSGSAQSGMDEMTWAINMTNNAITTIKGNYGVIYDVHQVKNSEHYLYGYSNGSGAAASSLYHYVAGEGYDSRDVSNRICYYYDSNNQKTFSSRHVSIYFRDMAVLINDLGLIF